jgi:hypothetical protein
MSLANLLKYIEAVTLLLPLVEKIVTMVEGLFSKLGPGQGAAKKVAVKEVAKAALVGYGLSLPVETIDQLVDSVVSIKNQTGEFTHGLSQAPPGSKTVESPDH